jgi:hypothetical protein
MFVIQRVLEAHGRLTLLDQNKVITPHPAFRLFSTTNTIGWRHTRASITAPSRSTRARWTAGIIVTTLNYLSTMPRRDRAGQGALYGPPKARKKSPPWCASPT